MSEKGIGLIFGGNTLIFISSFGDFLKDGTQFLAFSTAFVSLTLLVWKEKHTIKQIIKGGKNRKDNQ